MIVKPLEWSQEMPPNDDICYNHVVASTPFGRLVITWKGWKDYDSPTIDEAPWPDWWGCGQDLEEAKTLADTEYAKRVMRCLQSSSEPNTPNTPPTSPTPKDAP